MIDRTRVSNYVKSTISHLKSEGPGQRLEWQRDLFKEKSDDHASFLDRFENTPGESREKISEVSRARGRRKAALWALAGVAGLAAGIATAVTVGPILAPVALIVGAGTGLGGAVGASASYDSEKNFRQTLVSFEEDLKNDAPPSIKSGSVTRPPSGNDDWSIADPSHPLSPANPISPLNPLNM